MARDAEKARKLFKQGAEKGHPEALFNLGALHVTGTGVARRDFAKALHYFQLAGQQGHLPALHKLAQMHLHGLGTAKSCSMAVQLFKTVAERGPEVAALRGAYALWKAGDPQGSLLAYARSFEDHHLALNDRGAQSADCQTLRSVLCSNSRSSTTGPAQPNPH